MGRVLLCLIDDEALPLHVQCAAGGVHFAAQRIQNIPYGVRKHSFTCPRGGVDGDDQLLPTALTLIDER